jgi:phage terminase small subunit
VAVELTPQQEAFCQAYVETSNASEAYRRAYPLSIAWKPGALWVQACRALDRPNVRLRIEELQSEAQKRHEITLETIIKMLKEDRDLAVSVGQASAAVSATKAIAEYHGIKPPEKLEVTGKGGGPVRTESTDVFLGELAKLRKRIEETDIDE